MGRLKHILTVALLVVMVFACRRTEHEDSYRADTGVSMNLVTLPGVSGTNYTGVVGAVNTAYGSWTTNPNSAYPVTWSAAFESGAATVAIQNAVRYATGTSYVFKLLGTNGVAPKVAGDTVVMNGGAVGTNDYIWASSDTVTMTTSEQTVPLAFRHIFAQVRFELTVRGNKVTDDDGDFSLSDVSQLGYLTDGSVNVRTGVVKPNLAGAELDSAKFGTRYFVMPHNGTNYIQPSSVVLKVRINGTDYTLTLSDTVDGTSGYLRLNQNRCRVYRFNYDGLTVKDVKVPQWSKGEDIFVSGVDVPQWDVK